MNDYFFDWNWQEPDLSPILQDLSNAIADEADKFLHHQHTDSALIVLINAFLFYRDNYTTEGELIC